MDTGSKLINMLEKMEVDENTEVTLTYKDSVDVFHYTGDAEETAVTETDTVERLVDVIVGTGISFHQNLVEDARDQEHLEDYERGSYSFAEHIQEKICENFYDYYDYIDFETHQYDHKRGRTTVRATLSAAARSLIEHRETGELNSLIGWSAEFYTSNGNITVDL